MRQHVEPLPVTLDPRGRVLILQDDPNPSALTPLCKKKKKLKTKTFTRTVMMRSCKHHKHIYTFSCLPELKLFPVEAKSKEKGFFCGRERFNDQAFFLKTV